MGDGAHTFDYPPDIQSEKSRQQYKLKQQKENPETLFKDTSNLKGKTITTNLLFYTEHPTVWHTAFCTHFQHFTKNGICKGRQICIYEDSTKNPENRQLTINLYQNGTIMVQGNNAILTQFEKTFHSLKVKVNTEIANICMLTPTPATLEHMETSPHPNTEEKTNSEEKKSNSLPASPDLHNTVAQLQHSLALLEVEIIEISEHVQSKTLSTEDTEQLRDQLCQIRNALKVSIQELKGDISTLSQDRDNLQKDLTDLKHTMGKALSEMKDHLTRELTGFKVELQQRDTQIETLRTELKSLSAPLNNQTIKHPLPLTKARPPQRPTEPPPPNNTQREADTPKTASNTGVEHQKPSTNTPSTPKESPQPQSTQIEIAILMDSNGKFLQEKKLFPGHKTSKLWCPKTSDALRILSAPSFGTPSHIIIHTGTNDLRAQQERVGQLVCRVAEKAAETCPNAKITISTLLPRRDIHPDTINRVNADISRGCALLPSVHLTHHTSITVRDLYDHVHIKKDKVNVFAKALKDTAWGRQTSAHTTNRLSPPYHMENMKQPPPGHHWGPPPHTRHFQPTQAQQQRPRPSSGHSQKTQTMPGPPQRETPTAGHHQRPTPSNRLNPRQVNNSRRSPQHPTTSTTAADSTPRPALLPQPRNYAQALKGPAKPLEMGEIKQLLQYISAQLT